MSRIKETFDRLDQVGRKGFIPFVTAGDPDLATSLRIVEKLAECGADIIELGVPFSDPMADGPTIQRSSQRALEGGTTLRDVLDLARQLRRHSDVALVLFSYLNPVLRFGVDKFADEASDAGVDGVLFTDVVEDEAASLSKQLGERDIDLISLIAPTTTDERLANICANSRGFIYAVSRAGVTGARDSMSADAERLVDRARAVTDLPIAVGFGISTRQQVQDVWRYADAAVVGSAIVAEIEKAIHDPAGAVESFIKGLLPQFAAANVNPIEL